MTKQKLIILFLTLPFIVMGFQLVDTTGIFSRQKMHSYYSQKMSQFHSKRIESCRAEARTLARARVDSILIGKDVLINIDSFYRLPRPQKPNRPELKFDVDSLPVKPLFDRDSVVIE